MEPAKLTRKGLEAEVARLEGDLTKALKVIGDPTPELIRQWGIAECLDKLRQVEQQRNQWRDRAKDHSAQQPSWRRSATARWRRCAACASGSAPRRRWIMPLRWLSKPSATPGQRQEGPMSDPRSGETIGAWMQREWNAAQERLAHAERLLREWLDGSMTIDNVAELEQQTRSFLAGESAPAQEQSPFAALKPGEQLFIGIPGQPETWQRFVPPTSMEDRCYPPSKVEE